MTEQSDETALLRAFQADPGPESFRWLAERHLPLVWSVARRVLADEPAESALTERWARCESGWSALASPCLPSR